MNESQAALQREQREKQSNSKAAAVAKAADAAAKAALAVAAAAKTAETKHSEEAWKHTLHFLDNQEIGALWNTVPAFLYLIAKYCKEQEEQFWFGGVHFEQEQGNAADHMDPGGSEVSRLPQHETTRGAERR